MLEFRTLATVVGVALVAHLPAQQPVVADDFESGGFAPGWTTTSGAGTAVLAGGGAGGSGFFARVAGVSTAQGGLGVRLASLRAGSPGAAAFDLDLQLRVDPVAAGVRQFSLIVQASDSNPASASATFNLRYQDGGWQAYDGQWRQLRGLGAIPPGAWNRLRIAGRAFGSGAAGAAHVDLMLTDAAGASSQQNGVRVWQGGDPDRDPVRSLKIQDTWGNNPGFDVDDVVLTATPAADTVTITPVAPRAFSGVFPHTAAANDHSECGVGALLVRGGTLAYATYPPHLTTGSSDELYTLDLTTWARTTHLGYPGGTHANRQRDPRRGLDLLGAAVLDAGGVVGYLPVGTLRGRITGTAAHLTDPDLFYYATMEEGLYEVDLSDPQSPRTTALRTDGNHGGSRNLPGQHGKGLYSGQGRLYFTNNGAEGSAAGGLLSWDGRGDPEDLAAWTVVDASAQYTEVTGPRGPHAIQPHGNDPVWALGFDRRSVILQVRDAATARWTRLRLPKASATHDHPNGWYTEWPRIRDVGLGQGHLLNHHGAMFTLPAGFRAGDRRGLRPLNTFLKMIVDYDSTGGQVAFAANDASLFANALVQRAHSNLLFVDPAALPRYGGTPQGAGGVWLDDTVAAGAVSDPLFVGGYDRRVLHLAHRAVRPVAFTVELDPDGNGTWAPHRQVTVAAGGAAAVLLPAAARAAWLRVRAADAAPGVTAYALLASPPTLHQPALHQGLARAGAPTPRSQGLLRVRGDADFPLEYTVDLLDERGGLRGNGYYHARLDPATQTLELVAVTDPAAETALRQAAATTQDFGVDAASVYIDDGGTRWRLPRGDAAFDQPTAAGPRRGVREVVTERALMNIHGTFYERPRDFKGGGIARIRPVTTHGLEIFDYASWRGMLVLSGLRADAPAGAHVVPASDGRTALWFGNVDDLWAFGPPIGRGGPWAATAVTAGMPSDPYLIYGYDHKTLALSHQGSEAIAFAVEVDVEGGGRWLPYRELVVAPGQTTRHVFPRGFAARWVRLVPRQSTVATATFDYTTSTGRDDVRPATGGR